MDGREFVSNPNKSKVRLSSKYNQHIWDPLSLMFNDLWGGCFPEMKWLVCVKLIRYLHLLSRLTTRAILCFLALSHIILWRCLLEFRDRFSLCLLLNSVHFERWKSQTFFSTPSSSSSTSFRYVYP
jgi:hypothetical protein